MRLYVIAGHGQGDPGACANGYSEAERVRALASRMVELGGGEVGVYDQSLDLYQQGGPWSLPCGKGVPCLELHLDSAGASARGGHVIIKAGYGADACDEALANVCREWFPGRSQTITGRSDLQNVNVAAQAGQNYRLLECCFVTSIDDMRKLNDQMDDYARALLACFGIEGGETVTDEDIEKIARRVWEIEQGSWTADRVQRIAYMLKAMCGLGKEDTASPADRFDDIRGWTMGRWERMLRILKGLSGIPQEDTGDGMIATPMHVSLSDEDVERVAKRVAEIMKDAAPME